MKIRDLIGKPNFDLETAINIIHFRDSEIGMNQINNTIISLDFKNLLEISLKAIYEKNSSLDSSDPQTFLIEGMYGVGKTHFLSFLNILFDDTIDARSRDLLWEKMGELFGEEYQKLKNKKFLVVSIALHGFLQENLIDIIFREMEKKISKRFNININLSSPSKFIHFYKNCAPGIRNEIDRVISEDYEENGLEKFNALNELDDNDFYKKAEIIRNCMEILKVWIDDSYKIGESMEEFIQIVLNESFKQLDEQIINRDEIGFGGIILLIDEFSEYLKSQTESEIDELGRKRTLSSLQIQYLAEFIRDKDFFIFITCQGALYNIDPLFEKIKPRLKTLTLGHLHSVEIFNQLLLPEKHSHKTEIENLFPSLKEQFFKDATYSISAKNGPQVVDKELFFKCYPFHPKTIELLSEPIFSSFSRARTPLSYAQYTIEQSLDNDAYDLITSDTLFNYFQRIIKHFNSSKYEFIKDLISVIKSENIELSEKDKQVIIKVLRYLSLKNYQTNADSCIKDLLLDYDKKELEVLLNRVVEISEVNFQDFYLNKQLDTITNKQKYFIG